MENLTREQVDALREMGNIGAGNAATAMSQLLCKRVSIDIPGVKLMQLDKLSGLFSNSPDEIGVAVSLRLLGGVKGKMLVLFSQKSAAMMVDIITGRKPESEIFNVMESSAIAEASHILCSSYLNAVGEFLKFYQLIPLINNIFIERMSKIAENLEKDFAVGGENYLLPIENHLLIEDIELRAFVIFLLEKESVEKVLQRVGL